MAGLLSGIPDPTPEPRRRGRLADIPDPTPSAAPRGLLAGIPDPAAPAPAALRTLAPKAGVDISGLASDARPVLADLDSALAGRGYHGGIITSGFQKRAQVSEHSSGHAIDLVLPGRDMRAIAADLARQGFRAAFEVKGQRNPNGSVATGDHIHVTLKPRTTPRTLAELNAANYGSASAPRRDRNPAVPSRPAPQQGGGKAVVADLMGSLLRGEHLKPGAKPAPRLPGGRVTLEQAAALPAPALDVHSLSGMAQAAGRGAARAGKELSRPVNAVTAALNEFATRTQQSQQQHPRAYQVNPTFAARDALAAMRAGASAFKSGEPQEATFVRTTFNRTPENTNPDIYGLLTAGEQLTPLAYDPLNVVGGPIAKGVGAGARKLVGPAERAAQRVGGGLERAIPALRARAAGRGIIDSVIQPALRHKEDLQGIIREANAALVNLRRGNRAVDAAVRQTGEHPVYDLASRYAAADTGRLAAQGKVSIGAADAQALAAEAAQRGIPQQAVATIGNKMARNAETILQKQQALGLDPLKGKTRREWLEAFFTQDANGVPLGLHEARTAHRAELLESVAQHAAPAPGPGLAEVPRSPTFGQLGGRYLPKNTLDHLKSALGEIDQARGNAWTKLVGGAKRAYLFQPWTSAKNLVQNAAGVEIALQKKGGTMMDAALQAPSTSKELFQFWREGKLSPSIKEFSDYDPTFLKELANVKIADGTAGRFVRVGNRAIMLPTGKEAVGRLVQAFNPVSSEHIFMKMNGGTDLLGRLAGYKALRQMGVPAEEAVKLMKSHVISFGDQPFLASLDRYGVWTFNNVPVQLAKLALDTAIKRPDLLARPGQWQQRMLKAFGAQQAYETLPEDQKHPFVLPNPFQPGKLVDYSALSPLEQPYTAARAALEMATNPQGPSETLKGLAGKTILGPLMNLAYNQPGFASPDSNQKLIHPGAPLDEKTRQAVDYLVRTYNPISRFMGQMEAARQGRATGEGRYAEPKTPGELAGQVLGLRTLKGETFAEKQERLAPQIDARGAVADQFVAGLETALQARLLTNPYVAEAARLSDFYEAKRQHAAALDYYRKQLTAASNFTAQGKLAASGRERITKAFLRQAALAARVDDLGAQQPVR